MGPYQAHAGILISVISKRSAFLYGCFGGILPELLRYSKVVGTQQINVPPSGWIVYSVIVLLSVLAAGVLSVAWKPDTEYKAVWVGASFPAIVQTLVAVAPQHG